MSKGLGAIQRAVAAIFQANPNKPFSYADLAELAYPGEPIGKAQTNAVNRVVKALAKARPDEFKYCNARDYKARCWRKRWMLKLGGTTAINDLAAATARVEAAALIQALKSDHS